jgi:hypothetical protein
VLLDDAYSEAQVRPLIPGASGCAVLVTSRRRMFGLDVAGTVALDVLPAEDAHSLLARILGARRLAAEHGAAGEVLRLCGYLPFALRIAAIRLGARPAWPVGQLARRLADERERLSELSAGDLAVCGALDSTYRVLPTAEQALLRALGRLSGSEFGVPQAAALAGFTARETERLLDGLVEAPLVEAASRDDR